MSDKYNHSLVGMGSDREHYAEGGMAGKTIIKGLSKSRATSPVQMKSMGGILNKIMEKKKAAPMMAKDGGECRIEKGMGGSIIGNLLGGLGGLLPFKEGGDVEVKK